MTAAPVHLGGQRVLLDPLGAAVLPDQGVLAVADLHFEKGSAAAQRGSLVPPWDTAATLETLALLLRRWRPRIVVALGDSFHDPGGFHRMTAGHAARLHALCASAHFVWVLGNHDPVAPDGLGGEAVEAWQLDRLVFRHQAAPSAAGELSGHYHPKASVPTRAGMVTRPCFVADSRRLILPALGAYTGGLDVARPALARLFPRGGRAFLLGQGRLFSFSLAQTAAAQRMETGV